MCDPLFLLQHCVLTEVIAICISCLPPTPLPPYKGVRKISIAAIRLVGGGNTTPSSSQPAFPTNQCIKGSEMYIAFSAMAIPQMKSAPCVPLPTVQPVPNLCIHLFRYWISTFLKKDYCQMILI